MASKYRGRVDRDSAYERLRARAEVAARDADQLSGDTAERAGTPPAEPREHQQGRRYDGGRSGSSPVPNRAPGGRSDSIGEAFAKSFARQLGTRTGAAVVRGVLGSLFRSR